MKQYGNPMYGRPGGYAKTSLDLATEVASAVYRSYRAIRFYPANHPVVTQGLEQLEGILARALGEMGSLRLDVRDKTLLFEDVVIYGEDDPRDNLARLMSLDGLRSIVFHAGLEHAETMAFIEVLARAQEADRNDQDLATLLWELDLPNVDFTIVDPLLEGHSWAGKGKAVQLLRNDLVASVSELQKLELGPPLVPEFDPGNHPDAGHLLAGGLATAEELKATARSIEEDPDVLEQFLEVLMEVLSTASDDVEVESAAHAVSDVLSSYLEWGEFRTLTRVIERLQSLHMAAPDRGRMVENILAALATPQALRKAVYALDGARTESREHLENLLYALRNVVYPALIELLAEAGGKVSRRCILNVCAKGEGVPLSLVAPHLTDPRWYVVRNMVYLLGSLGNAEVMHHLEKVLDHPDERVRRETVRALGAIGGHRAAYLVSSCLTDPSPSVRVLSARSLPRTMRHEAAAALLTQITSRDFYRRDPAEIEAFFEALGEVADDRALPHLDELCSSRSIFRNRPAAIRLGALKVAGRIASPAAREMLTRAARSTDEETRRQAKRSLAEAERAEEDHR